MAEKDRIPDSCNEESRKGRFSEEDRILLRRASQRKYRSIVMARGAPSAKAGEPEAARTALYYVQTVLECGSNGKNKR